MGRGRGKTYELRARFTASADVTDLEAMEKKLKSLGRQVDALDKKKATLTIDERNITSVAEKAEKANEALDEMDSKKTKPKVDDKEIGKLEKRFDRLGKLSNALNNTKFGAQMDEKKLDRVIKTAQKAADEAFTLEYEAKMVGDDSLRRKAQKLQKDLDKTLMAKHEIKVGLEGEREMVRSYQQAQKEMQAAFVKRVQETERAAKKEAAAWDKMYDQAKWDMGKHFAKQAKVIKAELAGIDQALTTVTDRKNQITVTGDASQAYRELTELQSALKTQLGRAFKLMMTADNDDVKQKAAESHRLMTDLSNEVAEMRVTMKGKAELESSVASMRRNLQELTSRPWEAEVHGDTKQASAAFSALAAQARQQFSQAYRAEVRAESEGFPEIAAQAANLKRQLLDLSQQRARVAVELQNLSPVMAGLVSVKRAASDVEGTYVIRLDTATIRQALTDTNTYKNAFTSLLGSIASAPSSFSMFSNAVLLAQRAVMGLVAMLGGAFVISLGAIAGGLGIAGAALVSFGGGIGLLAGAIAPVINQLSNMKENQEKATSAQNAARNASQALESAYAQQAKAHQQVATTARQNEKAISQAVKAHEDAVRGVQDARENYQQAVQGVQDAERQGEEQIANAIDAHRSALRAVEDAQRNVGKTAQAINDAQVQAQEQVESAVRAHEMAIRSAEGAQRDLVMSQRAVEQAQYDYTQAQKASVQSQRELTMATEDYNDALATEQQRLLGLSYDLEGLQLNQKQLALDMQEAQQQMGEAQTPLEAQQAALRLEELQLRQKENVLAIDEAQRRLSEAQTEGTSELQSAYESQINAATGVEDALHSQQQAYYGVEEAQYQQGQATLSVQDAQYEVARTAREVQKAQVEGGRAVDEAILAHQLAQRDLNDAIYEEGKAAAGVGKAREDAARGVIDAQNAVAKAARGVDDAIRTEAEARAGITEAQINAQEAMQAALQGVEDANRAVANAAADSAAAQQKLNDILSELPTSKVQALADAAKALWEQWKIDTAYAQGTMVDLATHIIGISGGAMQQLATAANATADSMVAAFNNVIMAWSNQGVFSSFSTMLQSWPVVTQSFSEAMGYAMGGVVNFLAVAAPYAERFAAYVADAAYRFLEWTNSEAGRARLQQFFDSAEIVLPVIRDFIWGIASALVTWSSENPEQVRAVLQGIFSVLNTVFWLVGSVVVAFGEFASAHPAIAGVVGSLGMLGFALLAIPRFIRTNIIDLIKLAAGIRILGPTATAAGDVASAGLGKVTTATGNANKAAAGGSVFTRLGGWIKGAAMAAATVLTPAFWTAGVAIAGVTAPVWLVVAAVAAFAGAAYLIYQNWGTIGPWLSGIWDGIRAAASAAWNYISGDIYAAGNAIWTFLTTQWGYISQWWSQMMGHLGFTSSGVFTDIYNFASWAIGGIGTIISTVSPYVINGWKWMWDNLVTVVSGVWQILSGVVSGGLQFVLGMIMTTFGFWKGVFTGDWSMFWEGLSWVASGVMTALSGILSGIWTIISGLFYNMLVYLENQTGINFTAIYDWIAWAMNAAWDFIVWAWTGIWNYLFGGSVIPDIVNGFYTAMNNIYTYVTDPLYKIWDYFVWVWDGIWAYLFGASIMPELEAAFATSWGTTIYGSVTQALWDIWSYVEWAWDGIWAYLFGSSMMPDLEAAFATSWGTNIYGSVTQALWDIWGYVEWAWDGIWDYLFGNSIMPEMEASFSLSWNNIWEGAKAFGGWMRDTLTTAFGDAAKGALDWLAELIKGVSSILWYLPGTESIRGGLDTVAGAIDYYAEGGMAEGGMGTDGRNPRHIIWNEQQGSEAFIAEKGPKDKNMGYLQTAANWFDAAVVPKKLAMAEGGVVGSPIYMEEGGITDLGVTETVAGYGQEIYDAVGGGITYNTYPGHPYGWPEREPYSLDFWGPGGAGDSLQNYDWGVGVGDQIVGIASGKPDFSYYIWNGSDSYDGSIAATDPHYDHVHVTWMGDLGLGGAGGGGMGGWLRNMINTAIPQVPDLGEGLPADTAEYAMNAVRAPAVSYLQSLVPGSGSTGGGNADNQAIGQPMAAEYGWTGEEWSALVELWNRESNWDHTAVNPTSGAYGIPQALGHGDIGSDPQSQIAWGLNYILERYGSPTAALAFHDSTGWYGEGGIQFAQDGLTTDAQGWLNDYTKDQGVLSEQAQMNAQALADAVEAAGATPPTFNAGYTDVAGRAYSMTGETADNTAYFYGPDGGGFGAYYGEENAIRIAEWAESQPGFTYWTWNGLSSVPFFENNENPMGTVDELKIMWGGSLAELGLSQLTPVTDTSGTMPGGTTPTGGTSMTTPYNTTQQPNVMSQPQSMQPTSDMSTMGQSQFQPGGTPGTPGSGMTPGGTGMQQPMSQPGYTSDPLSGGTTGTAYDSSMPYAQAGGQIATGTGVQSVSVMIVNGQVIDMSDTQNTGTGNTMVNPQMTSGMGQEGMGTQHPMQPNLTSHPGTPTGTTSEPNMTQMNQPNQMGMQQPMGGTGTGSDSLTSGAITQTFSINSSTGGTGMQQPMQQQPMSGYGTTPTTGYGTDPMMQQPTSGYGTEPTTGTPLDASGVPIPQGYGDVQYQGTGATYTYDATGTAYASDVASGATHWAPAGVNWVDSGTSGVWKIYDGDTGGYAGLTYGSGTGGGEIVFDNVGGYGGLSTAVHEMGHAMGLEHVDEPMSIMNINTLYELPATTGQYVQPYDIQMIAGIAPLGEPETVEDVAPNTYAQGFAKGGIGTKSRNPQHIVWNEGDGNEAFIAQNGPREKQMGYLKTAASWFNMGVVPMNQGGFVSGVGEALGPTHYSWSPEVQGYVDYLTGTYGGSANTYEGHGNPGGSTEDMTADFWGGDRGVPIDPATGEQIAQAVLAGGGLAYMIWNGNYYGPDGSVTPWPEDPHYDHVHVSWAGGANLGTGTTPTGTTGAIDPATGLPYTTGTTPTSGYGTTPTSGYGTTPTTDPYAMQPMSTGTTPSYGGTGTTPTSMMGVPTSGTVGGTGGGHQQVNAQMTANTTNQMSGGGTGTVGAINQTGPGMTGGGMGTGMTGQPMATPEEQQMAMDTGQMANDGTMGIPGLNTGMQGLDTTMGGVGTGVEGMNQDMNTGLSTLNDTMSQCGGTMPTSDTTNPAIGSTNGYGAGGTPGTASNSATNTAVDSYSDWQNTGQTSGPGANIIMGGQAMAAMDAQAMPSSDAQYLGGKMDQLGRTTEDANRETEIGRDSLNKMVNGAVETAFAAIGSKRGRETIDKGQADKMNFDRLMKGM